MQLTATRREQNQQGMPVAFHCVQNLSALTIMNKVPPAVPTTRDQSASDNDETPQSTTQPPSADQTLSSLLSSSSHQKQKVTLASILALGNTAPRLMERMTPLSTSFSPGPFDVICGIGKKVKDHAGNLHFRKRIKHYADTYADATNQTQKSRIVLAIVDEIREASPFGGFVKYKDGRWHEVGDSIAREKVGQHLRDSLSNQYRSSSKSKRQKRLKTLGKMEEDLVEILSRNDDIKESMEDLSSKAKTGSEKDFTNSNTKILEAIKKDKPLRSEGHDVIKKAGL